MDNKKPNRLKLKNFIPFLNGRLPGQVVIQITNRCNAGCPQCGMRASEPISRNTLKEDQLLTIINSIADRGIPSFSLTGGEPLIELDLIVKALEYAGRFEIPFSRTGTNGFLFLNPDNPGFNNRINKLAERLSGTKLYTFWISIDSAVTEIHEKIRGLPGVIRGIEKALPIFHSHGIYPSANLGLNRYIGSYRDDDMNQEEFAVYYEDSLRKFYQFVIGLGFTMTSTCYPMSIKPETSLSNLYGASSLDKIVNFSGQEKLDVYRTLFKVIPEFRDKIRIFTPLSSLYSLMNNRPDKNSLYICRGGIDFFFIDCINGQTYPCGFRSGENLGDFDKLNWENLGKKKAFCSQCDWECFRDPSNLLSFPVLAMKNLPALLFDIIKNTEFYRLLVQDLRYSRICGFFDGRTHPDYLKMRRLALSFVKKSIKRTKVLPRTIKAFSTGLE